MVVLIRVKITLAEVDDNDKHPILDFECKSCHKDKVSNELVIRHKDNSIEFIDYDCIMRWRKFDSVSLDEPIREEFAKNYI